jgi:TonB family protein
MKKLLGWTSPFVALAFFATISVPSIAASFDCKTSKHPNEQLICQNKELSKLDDRMAALLRDLSNHLNYKDGEELKRSQRQWVKQSLDCGNDFICTKKLYRERIKQLSAMLPGTKEGAKEAKEISKWKESLILKLNEGSVLRPPVVAVLPPEQSSKGGSIAASPAPQREAPERIVNLALRIDKNGRVVAFLILSNSSGMMSFEEDVLERVRMMQPFPPLPKQWKAQSIDLVVPVDFASNSNLPLISDTAPYVSKLLTLLEGANKGEAESQYLLGKTFLDGDEVGKNPAAALSWLQKAAEQENAESEYLLGKMYEEGRGVVQDRKEAEIWFSKAAEHGNNDAKAALRQLQRQ